MSRPLSRYEWSDLDDTDEIHRLAEFVHDGGIVVFPTESSYALGVDPRSAEAVGAVCRLKRRPPTKPLPVVIGDQRALALLGLSMPRAGLAGLEGGWPGPLSIVLPCSRPLPAAGGRSELAVRIPGHRRLRKLLAAAGLALTATSANLSGEAPVLDPSEVQDLVGKENAILIDEGRLQGGPPSTLVRLDGDTVTVLRSGVVSAGDLRRLAPALEFRTGFSAGSVEIPVEDIS